MSKWVKPRKKDKWSIGWTEEKRASSAFPLVSISMIWKDVCQLMLKAAFGNSWTGVNEAFEIRKAQVSFKGSPVMSHSVCTQTKNWNYPICQELLTMKMAIRPINVLKCYFTGHRENRTLYHGGVKKTYCTPLGPGSKGQTAQGVTDEVLKLLEERQKASLRGSQRCDTGSVQYSGSEWLLLNSPGNKSAQCGGDDSGKIFYARCFYNKTLCIIWTTIWF